MQNREGGHREAMQLFSPDINGVFVSRPNRFLVRIDTEYGEILAHCPNPGRMQEILLPGCPVIVERNDSPGRKTKYALAAALHQGKTIPLNATRANRVARDLVLSHLFSEQITVRAEYSIGGSRFDFLVEGPKGTELIEVKCCTLCESGIAMFPDAPTDRGRRHVEELVRIASSPGEVSGGHLLFLVFHGDAKTFTPNIHTDPLFSQSLQESIDRISVRAVSLSCTNEGFVKLVNPMLPMRLDWVEMARENRGIYLLVLRYDGERILEVAGLGRVNFETGYYVYVGKAKRGLRERIGRHLRKRKKNHWHIDYLSRVAKKIDPYPIYTRGDLECKLAKDIAVSASTSIPGFGSSDCNCKSHLFYFASDPMAEPAFVFTLFRYRHVLCFNER